MSDLSHPWCKKCESPDYACDCDEPDFAEPAIKSLLRGEKIPDDHPFRKEREKFGLPMHGEKPK